MSYSHASSLPETKVIANDRRPNETVKARKLLARIIPTADPVRSTCATRRLFRLPIRSPT